MSWRNVSLVLMVVCSYQAWRGCHREPARATDAAAECTRDAPRIAYGSPDHDDRSSAAPATGEAQAVVEAPGISLGGFKVPAWAMWLAPQPGENLLDYRDRIVPIAQAAIAPHRERVAKSRDDFARRAGLDAQQRAQLDSAVQEAQTAIQDKVMGALMSGDLMPSHFKPMTGVALARDVLDSVDQADRKFMASLHEDQKAALAQHPFDFADYLLFSAHWEDALGITH